MEGKLPLVVSSDDEERESTSGKGKQIYKPYSAAIPVPPVKRVRPELIPMVNRNTCSSTCSNPFFSAER